MTVHVFKHLLFLAGHSYYHFLTIWSQLSSLFYGYQSL